MLTHLNQLGLGENTIITFAATTDLIRKVATNPTSSIPMAIFGTESETSAKAVFESPKSSAGPARRQGLRIEYPLGISRLIGDVYESCRSRRRSAGRNLYAACIDQKGKQKARVQLSWELLEGTANNPT